MPQKDATPILARRFPQHLAAIFPGLHDLEGRLMRRTFCEYRSDAHLYLAWCGNDSALAYDPATLRRWRTHLVAEGRAAATINRRLTAIRAVWGKGLQGVCLGPYCLGKLTSPRFNVELPIMCCHEGYRIY